MDPISILLVDDNPTFLKIAARFLQTHHEIIVLGTAEDGSEAVDQARKLHPNVVILDLGMPGMNGLDTIPRLRECIPELSIIALTLLDTDSYRKAALDAGADEFVPKANMNTELLPTILRVVENHTLRFQPEEGKEIQ